VDDASAKNFSVSLGKPLEKRVEALLISGEVQDNGSIWLDPLLRKPLPKGMLDAAATGQYTLELLNAQGKILLEQPFDLAEITHGERGIVDLAIPFIKGIARVVIKEGQTTRADKHASPSPPVVRILQPQSGEILGRGLHTIRWEASDSDGDPLIFLIQYSPDGGQRWQGIALIEDDAREAEFDVNELLPGTQGLLRITTSDGLHTAVATMQVRNAGKKE
jgi:hypothetical protein